MGWLLGGGVVDVIGRIAGYYAAIQALSIIHQILLLVAGVLVVLGFFWLTAKQPRAALVILGVGIVTWGVFAWSARPVAKSCPPPSTDIHSVSASWGVAGRWDRFWMDRHVPKAWKPYEAIARVRIGKDDLLVVHKGGRVLVIGPFDVRAVEPLSGR